MSVRILAVAVLVLVLASPVFAQCIVTGATFLSYGSGCSAFGQDPPAVTGSYTSCVVTLNLTSWGGNCPNFCLTQRHLAIGTAPQQVPIVIVPCDLLVVPDFILTFPASGGGTFVFPVPPISLAGVSIYLQGAAEFATPSGPQFEVSDGLQVLFQ
jgi:hypothetical protein